MLLVFVLGGKHRITNLPWETNNKDRKRLIYHSTIHGYELIVANRRKFAS